VQDLVHEHYLLIKPLWSFDQNSYYKLAEAYLKDSNFKQFCDLYHQWFPLRFEIPIIALDI